MSAPICEQCGRPRPAGEVCPACALTIALDLDTNEEFRPGGQVGGYFLVRPIGEGGMGQVWLAEQVEPVRRQVALKVIKVGLDTKAFIARFQAEKQALALLDHPAVAKVYDAGMTESGRPYFVLEYVAGEPLQEYCDRQRLPVEARLALFQQVCRGVEHAHQRGVIHRDLKSSNVLIATSDGTPHPKIIDFGVAKAIDHKLAAETVFTELGVMIGTPEYMSPEQASGGGGVDTRTDVYALGVILYRLLTGTHPIASEELRGAGYDQMYRAIRERDPALPSRRLLERESGRSPEASRRIRGDLDWITMRALEKDRERRYGSCSEFIADIERHLTHRPVHAGPPSAVYRLRKFVRRHRSGVAIVGTLAASLLVGLGATTWLWRDAQRNRDLATARYDQVVRLSDLKNLADFEAAARDLWPAHPPQREAIEAWLRQGRELAAALPFHEATLQRMRERANGYDASTRERDRRTHPRFGEIDESRREIEDVERIIADVVARPADPDREEVLDHYEGRLMRARQRLERVEALTAERRSWEFDDVATQWQHDTLTDLVDRLRRFADPDPWVGTLASVERRLRDLESVERRTLIDEEARHGWARAIAELAADPAFAGLPLEPQVGLLPLGKNPDSGLWEFWHVASGERPFGAPGRWEVRESTGMVFVLLPGGRFWMGTQADDAGAPGYDPQAGRRERFVSEVALDPFFIGKYEVTQGQWRRMTNATPSRWEAGTDEPGDGSESVIDDRHPVESLLWTDARDGLRRFGLDLPTESQWAYAIRAGTTSPWYTGDRPVSLDGYENLFDRRLKRMYGPEDRSVHDDWLDDGYVVHAPVGSFLPNAWGLHDMGGNVSEWCRDFYRSPYYRRVEPGDGFRRIPFGTGSHIIRGSSWRKTHQRARSGSRAHVPRGSIEAEVGVRAVRTVMSGRDRAATMDP